MSPQMLYRRLMREAKQMHDYNFRMYSLRRIRAGFDRNRSLQGDAAQEALLDGEKQLAVLARQSVLSRLYPSAASVMESPMAVEK
ncbi:complex 1 LYR family protein [Nitzschia inconspicua]|uniref:Complex 1 LYR family protein n=1 Tax=Nitzschia inconspicua TaxID=303405 RepID=A0A9K3PII6_9STRA|nr:complex 1 LYR family protein [Nitzschia inconspicua]